MLLICAVQFRTLILLATTLKGASRVAVNFSPSREGACSCNSLESALPERLLSGVTADGLNVRNGRLAEWPTLAEVADRQLMSVWVENRH